MAYDSTEVVEITTVDLDFDALDLTPVSALGMTEMAGSVGESLCCSCCCCC